MTGADLPEAVVRATDTLLDALDSRAPGLVEGLHLHGSLAWGEFFRHSDVDAAVTLTRRPDANDLAVLAWAHGEAARAVPDHPLDAFHCLVDDLRRPASGVGPVPVAREGGFVPAGVLADAPVRWAELATRGLTVVGTPASHVGVHHDPEGLAAYARHCLATQWRGVASELATGWRGAGRRDDAAPRYVLGVARLHHLLATGELTSASGAGRYVVARLDPYWHPIAREALRARETPDAPTAYARLTQRGRDVRDFVAWVVSVHA